jgi:sec-independent protein translocase protein TatA
MQNITDMSALLAWTPGPWEIVLIIVVVLLLFGGKKLPELARGLGKGVRMFKKELHDVKDAVENESEQTSQNDDASHPHAEHGDTKEA